MPIFIYVSIYAPKVLSPAYLIYKNPSSSQFSEYIRLSNLLVAVITRSLTKR